MADPAPTAPLVPAPVAPKPAISVGRRRLFRLAVPVAFLLLVWLAGEIYLRATGAQVSELKQFIPPIYRQDPDTAWSLKRDYDGTFASFLSAYKIHTSSEGWRGHELAATPPANRIISIGDSNTFGYGVGDDECYPAQLEKRLREKLDPAAEVVNTGVSGYDTVQERIVLEKRGMALKPSAVILQWNINDLEVSNLQTIVMDDGALIGPNDLAAYEKLKRKRPAFWTNSVFLVWLNVNTRILKHRNLDPARTSGELRSRRNRAPALR